MSRVQQRRASRSLTRAELAEEVAAVTGLPHKQAELLVGTVLEALTESLQEGSPVELRGFGSFRIRERQARVGRNPKTGESVQVPAKRIPYFRPGKELQAIVNW